MSGFFINFEGIDGAGKSDQIVLAHDYYKSHGFEVCVTREPGGTPFAEKIRALLLHNRDGEYVYPMSEVFLFYAARIQHYENVIKPALDAGKIVLCDRFSASTIAYQGAKGGVPYEDIMVVDSLSLGQHGRPDITILIDVSESTSIKRSMGRAELDDIERSIVDKLGKIRSGYLDQVSRQPSDFFVVSGEDSRESISKIILSKINKVVGLNDEKYNLF